MTVLAEDWLRRAQRLAEQLVAARKLKSEVWRDAVCSVPRHEFVPEVFRQDRSVAPGLHRDTPLEPFVPDRALWVHGENVRTPVDRNTDPDTWMRAVYSASFILTRLDDRACNDE